MAASISMSRVRLSIGVSAGYNWMVPFGHAVGSRTDYSGAMVGVSAGLLFGKGS